MTAEQAAVELSASSLERQLDELLSENALDAVARERGAFDRGITGFENNLVLFGAGNLGRQLLKHLRASGLYPVCFSDNRAELWGKIVDGLIVMSPQDAAARHGATAMFIVTIWNDKHRFTDTRRQLTSAGCANILPVNSLRWKFADQLLPALWEDLPHRLLERASAIRDGFRFWSDQQSRCEYVGHIRWRLHADFDALPAASFEESYFPSVLGLRNDEVFVDCGAFDGDTLRSFIQRRGEQFKKLLAFEPDPALYGKLKQWLGALQPTVRSKIQASPVAVGARRERLNFDSSAGTFVSDGALTVEAAPLDELLGDDVPTYIKMDIEGAEMDALAGARSALSRYRPALAVCVYHRPNDLWNIPRYIHDVDSRYRLYLRSHDPDGWQTVCYAVPQERALGA